MKKVTYKDHDGNPVSIINKASNVLMDNGETLEKAISKADMFTPNITQESSISKVGQGVDVDYHESVKDGIYEECVFEGRTLVNLCPNKAIDYTAGSDWDGYNVLLQQSSSLTNNWRITYDIKPNTKYLIRCRVESIGNSYYNINNASSSDCVFGSYLRVDQVGLHQWIVTSKNDLTTTNLALRCQNGYSRGNIKIKDFMILEYREGMENWDIPYFEGICDVKMPILQNVGKNLFDGALKRGRYTISEGIYFTDDTTVCTVNKIKVKPSKSYTLSIKDGTLYNISEYSNGVYIKSTLGGTIVPFTTSSTTNEIHISFKGSDLLLKAQLEESPTETTYESYKTNILQTSEEIVLRSLPNGTKDTYNALTGEYVQRIGEVVLNGSESWTIREDLKTEQTNCFYISVKDKKKLGLVLSDKLSALTNPDKIVDNTIEDFRWTGGYFFIHKNISTVVDFKAWLQSNPITVQYELATPITTIVKPSTIPFAYSNGHVILESGYAGQSLLPTLKYSVITSRTGQVVQTTKILHQQEKQIASLEDKLSTAIINLKYNNIIEQYKIGFAEDSLNKEEVI